MGTKGLLISIDAVDSKLANNQAHLIAERLKNDGYTASWIDLSDSTMPGAYFVNKYESDSYQKDHLFEPFTPAVFYALNHFDASAEITELLSTGAVVVCSNYVISNVLSRIQDSLTDKNLVNWIDSLEFGMLGLPRPDVTIAFTDTSNKSAQNLISQFGKNLTLLDAQLAGRESLTQTHAELWSLIQPYVSNLQKHVEKKSTGILNESQVKSRPSLQSNDELLTIQTTLSTLAVLEVYRSSQDLRAKIIIKPTRSINLYNPPTLDTETAKQYQKKMQEISSIYSEIEKNMSEYRVKAKLKPISILQICAPLATAKTVELVLTKNDAELFCARILSSQLGELRDFARNICNTYSLDVSRMSQLAVPSDLVQKYNLQPIKGDDRYAVKLTSATPKNEFDTIPDILFSESTLSYSELIRKCDELSYSEKESVLAQPHTQDLRLSKSVQYMFDVISDISTLSAYAAAQIGSYSSQHVSPHYSYRHPKSVSDALCDDLYIEMHDLSFELYQLLHEAGYPEEAQYASLTGHRVRTRITLTLDELVRLKSNSLGQTENKQLKNLIDEMADQISETHPILSKYISTATTPVVL